MLRPQPLAWPVVGLCSAIRPEFVLQTSRSNSCVSYRQRLFTWADVKIVGVPNTRVNQVVGCLLGEQSFITITARLEG